MEVISTRRYEARPPADSHASILVDPANAVATVKEEEWETRKKKEITTTRQIETRVKRQVVLEDGEVVVDSGPLVTTNTTEDVEQQEHTTQERRTTGDEPQKVDWPAGAKPGAAVVQKELNETVVKSREEIEELLETEDRQQLGDISDEAYLQAVRKNRGDLGAALAAESRRQPVSTGPRVLQHTTRSNKVVDTEKTLERSELKQGGQIVTERKTTVEHEEIKDDELPASAGGAADELEEGRERRKEATQRYVKTRDEDIVDYVVNGERVGREMRFVSETTEAERTGEWPAAEALRGPRLGKHGFAAAPAAASPGSRKDAVTRQPLDLEEEDEARKFETSKWLESHFGSESLEDGDEPPGHTASYINVTMKSACPPRESMASQQRSAAEPAGYFHGISEWSERYHSTEKQSSFNARTKSPSHYVAEAPRREQQPQQQQQKQRRPSPPSPPARRRQQQQPPPRPQEAPQPERPSSPVHVVQRTWESRSREERRADSRSASPPAPPGDERQRPSKSPSPAKYKIGESFRKLVGKLRSASSERRGKRPTAGSSSQLTQTDEGSTYLQYNSVDRNVPLGPDYEPEERPPERPPRSPRNPAGNPPSLGVKGRYRSSRSGSPRNAPDEHKEPRSAHQPIHRYYLGEDPYGGSIYGREKGYRETKIAHSNRHRIRPTEDEYSAESSSLGRFSKSTSRLGQELEQNEYERTNAQTLPRKIQHTSTPTRNHQQQTTTTTTTTTRRMTNGHGNSARFNNSSSSTTTSNNITNNNNNNNTSNNKNYSYDSPNRQYGSLINISFKNTVNTPPKATHFVQTTINTQPPPPPPLKPERTYKSTLSRSKSFNVEIADDGVITTPRNTTYSNNIKSSSQLNKLNETPPLKSPGILASISRSNRDLLRNGKLDYY